MVSEERVFGGLRANSAVATNSRPLSEHLFFNIEPRLKTLGYDLLPLRGKLKLPSGRFPLTPAPSMT